jgi:predicted TIM-barrel fold metal-dependent hydrolase
VLACSGDLVPHVGAANHELRSEDHWMDHNSNMYYNQKHLSKFSIPHTTSQIASLVPVWQTIGQHFTGREHASQTELFDSEAHL